ncbi:alpha-glucuronidase family glycosyl hydrolase [Fulvivirga ligni]|uniref:alpha-glucuronidase family glycosyl hydrolase n=1 Tax=Fulvivirga ligni TaxID=2904246 RepID=UPI001F48DB92|nr:alpha-glucuronidase family glycosyl hydrolase [Fulvivirga ligni]UII23329.1 alpha-glucuronidase [Fulvivirga ligni]
MKFKLLLFFLFVTSICLAEDGYDLWLRYKPIEDTALKSQYKELLHKYVANESSPTMAAAVQELKCALNGLLDYQITTESKPSGKTLLMGTPENSKYIASMKLDKDLQKIGNEGFIIISQKGNTVITANTDVGVLYGTFHFLQLVQMHQPIERLHIVSSPKVKLRVLNHWDNLDRTVERGYAGFSLWDWHKLPDYIDPKYIDYARANASIGINGTVLTNVNANALILTDTYIQKVKALADAFRPYGLKVYLTARFSAPIEIGGLKTADPLNEEVKQWWKDKVDEIYKAIPDFGGFLVKANSEGQPGPQNYGRTHADGANMMADAVSPHGGVVMWRAFVYSNEEPDDRAKQAYNEFKPLDGKFRENVIIQVKNGAIDFQPREPFHPLFGAMPKTPLMMEFQITQEYLGQGTHLAYLAEMYKECLDADTYAQGKGSTVAKVIDGSLDNHQLTGMAGVSNIGTDRNWTGQIFGQANWYCFGRLAWDHQLTSEAIVEEWIRMTFSNEPQTVKTIKNVMLGSREAVVNYMTPLGLHHMMGWGHHYGPGPWVANKHRADWTSVYYHKADKEGIGFDRTASGSNAVSQYFPEVAKQFSSLDECPEKYLLWFHHLPWTYTMKSGRSLWDELCYKYQAGVDSVGQMQEQWNSLQGKVDEERFDQVKSFLQIQKNEAEWWRNACLLYFQTFSGKPIPDDIPKADHTLEYYEELSFPYAPGH